MHTVTLTREDLPKIKAAGDKPRGTGNKKDKPGLLSDDDAARIANGTEAELRAIIEQASIAKCSIKAAMEADEDVRKRKQELDGAKLNYKAVTQPYKDDSKAEDAKIDACYDRLCEQGKAE